MPTQVHEWMTFPVSRRMCHWSCELALRQRNCRRAFSAVCPGKVDLYGRRSTAAGTFATGVCPVSTDAQQHVRCSTGRRRCLQHEIHAGAFGVTSKDTAIATSEGRSTTSCSASVKARATPKSDSGQGCGKARCPIW
jgi:hypothetical protein